MFGRQYHENGHRCGSPTSVRTEARVAVVYAASRREAILCRWAPNRLSRIVASDGPDQSHHSTGTATRVEFATLGSLAIIRLNPTFSRRPKRDFAATLMLVLLTTTGCYTESQLQQRISEVEQRERAAQKVAVREAWDSGYESGKSVSGLKAIVAAIWRHGFLFSVAGGMGVLCIVKAIRRRDREIKYYKRRWREAWRKAARNEPSKSQSNTGSEN